MATKDAKEIATAIRSKDPQQVIDALKNRDTKGQHICKFIADDYNIKFELKNPEEFKSYIKDVDSMLLGFNK